MKKLILGVDEAGRGPLAGPVTAACVAYPQEFFDARIQDSKKLSELRREELFRYIQESSVAQAVVCVGQRRIDSLNILQATRLAMKLAVERVKKTIPEKIERLVLIDGNQLLDIADKQEAVVKGDSKVCAIAAASILDKVTRDRLMQTLDQKYRGYGFESHKGYPTKWHKQKIQELGPSRVHRRSFAGVKEHVQEFAQEES